MQKRFNKKQYIKNNITAIYNDELDLIEDNRIVDPERKYSILDRLQELPHNKYVIAKKELPKALGVSKSTFDKWIYFKYSEPNQIPLDKIAMLANFFNVRIENLMNEHIVVLNLNRLEELRIQKAKRDFGLF